ncbi:MAG: hypothetical protein C0594_06215 [Marinilabiliales bacterium]|nr:MAG: hypothetical protein C0594_06215 [Marinilabiliales bacterium]
MSRVLLISMILLTFCNAFADTIKLKYPVVLVHGIAIRDDFKMYEYWGDIPDILKKNDIQVFLSGHDSYNTHAENAHILQQRINEILTETTAEKVNIIAHSKGGIEARYMISVLNMEDKVASLTTISTPHRGSYMASVVMDSILKNNQTITGFVDFAARMYGDIMPDSYKAGKQLTPEYMAEFNSKVKDEEGVYYQSYGSSIGKDYPSKLWQKMWQIMYSEEGDNDGLVSLESCKWGEFKGSVGDNVSHADIIGMPVFTNNHSFDTEAFILKIISDLQVLGF